MVTQMKTSRARIRRLARPLRGIITPKYQPEDDQTFCWCSQRRKRQRLRPVSGRVKALAVPLSRNYSHKFVPECRPASRSGQRIVPYGTKVSTRLNQLALPYVRNLVCRKNEIYPYVPPKRIGVLNQYIQKSSHTVYSRLANTEMQKKIEPRSKLTKQDWSRHEEWLSKCAKPKKCFSEPKVIRRSKPIDFEYMYHLAKPKWPVKPYTGPPPKPSDPIQPISKAVLEFEMTPAYQRLATPFKPVECDPEFETYENPFDLPRDVAKIKSVGLKTLAEPKHKTKRFAKGDNASVVFLVSEFAKKAKPSAKTKKLAEPRKSAGEEPKANAFTVSKSALKPLKPNKQIYYNKMSEPIKRGAK